MSDAECVRFLQWALPRLGMRWRGFRRVRGQVCKRLSRRMRTLGLGGFERYRIHLEEHAEEWAVLDGLCRVTVSRFRRDRPVFDFLEREALPALARAALERGERTLRFWSAGCASGEEPYSLALAWKLDVEPRFPRVGVEILATDADAAMLERAERARYRPGSLRDAPPEWLRRAFVRSGEELVLEPEYQRLVTLERHDIRHGAPEGAFDLIACRNLPFTYCDTPLQREIAQALRAALLPGGALVLGVHETLPEGVAGFEEWSRPQRVYRRSVALPQA